ncbi:MAG: hypothetical protein OCD01_05155 [Fibrobacterales bacterium]
MATEQTKYDFNSWYREGISQDIIAPNAEETHASIAVTLDIEKNTVDNTKQRTEFTKEIPVIGPGEISGFNAQQIVRTWPKNATQEFPKEYIPFIEFHDEDFLWRYTPEATPVRPSNEDADGESLTPWLTLLCLKDGDFERVNENGVGVVTIGHDVELPDLSKAWQNAHVHINDLGANTPAKTFLKENPLKGHCRLLSLKALSQEVGVSHAYTCFLVPTYERGRIAGMSGTEAKRILEDVPAARFSWENQRNGDITLPIYHSWNFSTATEGDFETLARRLAEDGSMPEGVKGYQSVDPVYDAVSVADLGKGLVLGGDFSENSFKLGAALTPIPKNVSEVDPASFDTMKDSSPYEEALSKLVALDKNQSAAVPMVVPPGYGKFYLQESETPGWFHQLNEHRSYRATAGIGTSVIKKNQEKLMEASWKVVGDVVSNNEALQGARFASLVNNTLHTKRLSQANEAEVAHFAGRVTNSPTMVALKNSVLPTVVLTPGFKRIQEQQMQHVAQSSSRSFDNLFEEMTPIPQDMLQSGSAEYMRKAYARKLDSMMSSGPYMFLWALHKRGGQNWLRRKCEQAHLPAGSIYSLNDVPSNTLSEYIELKIERELFRCDAYNSNKTCDAVLNDLSESQFNPLSDQFTVRPSLLSFGFEFGERRKNSQVYNEFYGTQGLPYLHDQDIPIIKAGIAVRFRGMLNAIKEHSTIWQIQTPEVLGAFNRTIELNPYSDGRERYVYLSARYFQILFRHLAFEHFLQIQTPGFKEYLDQDLTTAYSKGMYGCSQELIGMKSYTIGRKKYLILGFDDAYFAENFTKGSYNKKNQSYVYEEETIITSYSNLAHTNLSLLITRAKKLASFKNMLRYGKGLNDFLVSSGEEKPSLQALYFHLPTMLYELSSQDGINATVKQTTNGTKIHNRVMAHPTFNVPAVKYLLEENPDYLLPGIDTIPDDTVMLLKTNTPFIESFMVGLNHEMSRELQWREFPTDMRGSYFQTFWDKTGTVQGESPDIRPLNEWAPSDELNVRSKVYKRYRREQFTRSQRIKWLYKYRYFTQAEELGSVFRHYHIALSEIRGHARNQIEWPSASNMPNESRIQEYKDEIENAVTKELGGHGYASDASGRTVLFMKTKLFDKYPNTIVFAMKQYDAAANPEGLSGRYSEKFYPSFTGTLPGGISWFGFDVDADDFADINQQWAFALQERPGEFNFDSGNISAATLEATSAKIAKELLNEPVLYVIKAEVLLK